jgi:DNA-binding transcriptional LysR family regulator
VHIRDVPVDRLVDAVASGDADLAMGPDRAVGDDVERIALFNSPWVMWCAPSHPLARRRSVTWAELRAHPLVAAGRDHERSVAQMHEALPGNERITPIDVVDNISTALGIAAADLAATLSPAYVEALAKPLGLVKRSITDPEVMRQVCLYRATRRASAPAAEGFAEYLAAHFTAIQTAIKSPAAARSNKPKRNRA